MHWFFKLLLAITAITLLYFICFYILPNLIPAKKVANSAVSGLIFRNQIWQGNIRVVGDTFTFPGTKVTILPGTNVIVARENDTFNLDFLPWHSKVGINNLPNNRGIQSDEPFWNEKEKIQLHLNRLQAIGTKEQPIVFKSDADDGSPYDFNVININSGILSFAFLSNYRRLEIGSTVVLSHNQFNNTGECSVCITGGKPTLSKNSFGRSLRESIWVERASPNISDNSFSNTSGVGIRLNNNQVGQPFIFHNTFEMSGHKALVSLTGDEVVGGLVSYNVFSGNSVIELTCDSKLNFAQNMMGLVYFEHGGCANSYTFGDNFWGTTDRRVVLKEKILGTDPQFEVIIPLTLASPPDKVGKRL